MRRYVERRATLGMVRDATASKAEVLAATDNRWAQLRSVPEAAPGASG